uniref:Desiccation-related protein PCC13-62 n=1 Tax=Physcomitrium patens TaxID=3218 RepID=A0A2K1KAR0_PHYPA|nr:hypothetical protein PHYPA_010048 [Physcomitrium patens]
MEFIRGCAVALWAFLLIGSFAAAADYQKHPPHAGGLDIQYECKARNKTTSMDKKLTQIALNLEYLEAEYFLWASHGYGLDKVAPYLVDGGPAPHGAQKANLDPYYNDLFLQMGLQEVGHVRAIKKVLGDPPKCAFPRTLLDVSKKVWADSMDKAFMTTFGKKLSPPFDPMPIA